MNDDVRQAIYGSGVVGVEMDGVSVERQSGKPGKEAWTGCQSVRKIRGSWWRRDGSRLGQNRLIWLLWFPHKAEHSLFRHPRTHGFAIVSDLLMDGPGCAYHMRYECSCNCHIELVVWRLAFDLDMLDLLSHSPFVAVLPDVVVRLDSAACPDSEIPRRAWGVQHICAIWK